MQNLHKITLGFFTVSFVTALALNSWVAASVGTGVLILFLADKYLSRIYPERIPEPTAGDLLIRQQEFEHKIQAELRRFESMSHIKTSVGMR
jgi:hypothetical protein